MCEWNDGRYNYMSKQSSQKAQPAKLIEHPFQTHRGGLAKGAASTAGDDICTAVVVEGRVFTTDDDGEKAAVTPSSAARERRETFIFLSFVVTYRINYYYCNNSLIDREQCY